jgi:hypothetical protein
MVPLAMPSMKQKQVAVMLMETIEVLGLVLHLTMKCGEGGGGEKERIVQYIVWINYVGYYAGGT